MLEVEEQRWLKSGCFRFGRPGRNDYGGLPTRVNFLGRCICSRPGKRALGNSLPPRARRREWWGEWKFALAKKGQQWISSRLCTSLCKFYQNTTRAMFNYINIKNALTWQIIARYLTLSRSFQTYSDLIGLWASNLRANFFWRHYTVLHFQFGHWH